MKKVIKALATLACVWLVSVMVGFGFGYLEDTMADTDTTTHTENVLTAPGCIHIEGLAERLKSHKTRLYYMIVAEVEDGRARLAREDGQSWWINDLGFKQFEHVLTEMNDYGTYKYNDDTIENVWQLK